MSRDGMPERGEGLLTWLPHGSSECGSLHRFPGAAAASPEERSFRAELREFLAGCPAPSFDRGDLEGSLSAALLWHGALADAGFPVPVCPDRYGGRERSIGLQLVQIEEMALAGGTISVNLVGIAMLTPLLLAMGTEAQRMRWLPGVARGEQLWCQLFSEPDAGSDLFGLRTTADIDGGTLRVNGQKIWSSTAQQADFGLMLARTDPSARRKDGISCFVVDMRSPGITVRPIRQVGGSAEFAEVFFDDVVVPAEHLIGAPHQGAMAALQVLASERSGLSMGHYAALIAQFEPLLAMVQTASGDRWRGRVIDLWSRLALQRLGALRQLRVAGGAGGTLGVAAAGKLAVGRIAVELASLRTEVLGLRGLAAEVDDPLGEVAAERMASCLALSIGGGTHEMQRNAVGEGLLGLPR